jgi:hypothetical protein
MTLLSRDLDFEMGLNPEIITASSAALVPYTPPTPATVTEGQKIRRKADLLVFF